MYFKAIALVLLLTGCQGTVVTTKTAQTFCGLPVTHREIQPQTLPCPNRTALCSNPAGGLCEYSYARDTEFWFECGPTRPGPICPADACSGSTSSSTVQIDRKICQAIDLSAVVQLSNNDVVKEKLTKDGDKLTRWVSPAGELTFIHFVTPDSQWIVFEPSVSACNWITDFTYERVPAPEAGGMMIQQGFYGTALSTFNILQPILAAQQNPKPLYLAGHSLGGAIATVEALMLAQAGITIAGTLTFGQPQVTDAAGVQIFKQHFTQIKLLRTINVNDMIPNGFTIFGLGYEHFGPELRLEKNPATDQTVYAYLQEPDGRRLVPQLDLSRLANHMIPSYLADMKAALGCKITFSEATQ